MRKFYDLCVSADLLTAGALEFLRELGFHGVAASISVQLLLASPETAMVKFEELKRLGREEGLDVVARLSVDSPMREGLVKRVLRKWRPRVELIAVYALNRQLTAFACRDTRVDILTLVPGARLLKGDLMYMQEHGKHVELLLAPLQEGDERARARKIAYYVAVLNRFARGRMPGAKLVFSSGAADLRGLRDARSMASLLHALGLPYDSALDALSKNAVNLITECREKLSGIIPVRGVRVLEGGGGPSGGQQ